MKSDVVIIGGSAAGLFTAHLLASKGLQIRVFEGEEHLDPHPRTLIVTSQMRDLLGSLGDQAVVNEIHRFELFADGRVATVTLQRPDLVIERSILIRELAVQAESSGAEMVLGRRFLDLYSDGRELSLTLERRGEKRTEAVLAEAVVGADGAFSQVAQAAGWPQQPTVPVVQAVVPLPQDLSPDTARVWFLPEETPYFYWLIPESPTQGVLGLIGEEGHEIRKSLERFLKRQGLKPVGYQGARIPVYTRWIPIHRKVGRGDVYLVGDAAGHVKVTTVGGIVTGFRGAMGVAEAILNGGSSPVLRISRRELDLHLWIRRVLHRFRPADYARLLDLLTPSTRRALSVRTRDEAGKVLWSVLLSQPRLLLLGLRALLASSSFPR